MSPSHLGVKVQRALRELPTELFQIDAPVLPRNDEPFERIISAGELQHEELVLEADALVHSMLKYEGPSTDQAHKVEREQNRISLMQVREGVNGRILFFSQCPLS